MKKKSTDREVIRLLRATGDLELKKVADNFKAGKEFFLLSLKTLEAAEKVKLPKGIQIKDISFTTSTKKGEGILAASAWIIKVVSETAARVLGEPEPNVETTQTT